MTDVSENRMLIKVVGFGFAAGLMLGACGKSPSGSNLDWEQSRTDTKRYAYLWQSDLTDTFLFGASVIEVDGFLSNALNFVIRPQKVKLQLAENNTKLQVVREDNANATLMAFDVGMDGTRAEIDFASSGNDLQLRSLVSVVGGQFTVRNRDGYWLSRGAPSVESIDQDNDTVVVNLKHTVQQVLLGTAPDGRRFVREVISDTPGDVIVRVWLKRQKSLLKIGAANIRTVGQAKAKNIGYFSSQFVTQNENQLPLQRFALGDAEDSQSKLTYYLKDFPAKFVEIGKKAVLSWNKAFPQTKPIEVKVAPDHIDAGDPRYHVIKWFDGTDRNLRWAGVAKMIVNPDDGLVMAGGVYIQGNTLVNLYKGITSFSQAAAQHDLKPTGRIGGVDFDIDDGENPVFPFFTDTSVDFEEYMQGYYGEVVAHEVGHVLGLRHNFKASTELTNGIAASVMDYAPRAERNKFHGPGFYDLAAVRYGYFGEEPQRTLPFCTDQDVQNQWNCNQGDHGDPITYAIRGMIDGANLLSQVPVEVEQTSWIKSLASTLKTGEKMLRLKDQIPAAQRAVVEEKMATAIRFVQDLQPHDSLSGDELRIVRSNIAKMKQSLRQ